MNVTLTKRVNILIQFVYRLRGKEPGGIKIECTLVPARESKGNTEKKLKLHC